MQSSNSSSPKRVLNKRGRLLVGIIVAIVAVIAIIFGIQKAIAAHETWKAKQPLLVIQDSYGKLHKVYKDAVTLTITGPARVWSPLHGIAVREEKWSFAHFQTPDTAIQLATQGGSYIVFIQPADWSGVDNDLKHCLYTMQINLL